MLTQLLLFTATLTQAATLTAAPADQAMQPAALSLRQVVQRQADNTLELPDDSILTCDSRQTLLAAEAAKWELISEFSHEFSDWKDGMFIPYEPARIEGDTLILSYGLKVQIGSEMKVIRYREHILKIPGGAKCKLEWSDR